MPGDPKGRTYSQVAAEGQFNTAIKGKTEAAREIADRLEGRAVQPFGDDTPSMSVTVNLEAVREEAVWEFLVFQEIKQFWQDAPGIKQFFCPRSHEARPHTALRTL
jgi:hypothetical protein